jgi:predicted Zn finger-like uncharacterized protein
VAQNTVRDTVRFLLTRSTAMRIECPHCHHRGFSALAKLTSNPGWPVRCKYCQHSSHARPAWSAASLVAALLLLASIAWALVGAGPWWLTGVTTLLLAGSIHQLLRHANHPTSRLDVKRRRRQFFALATLAVTAALLLLVVIQINSTAPAAATSAAAAE